MSQVVNRSLTQSPRIAVALAWEFWARGWRGILLGPLGALLFPGFLSVLEMSKDGLDGFAFTRTVLRLFPFFWITILCLGSILFMYLQNPRLRYTLPAPSWLLVAGPMVCAMLTMFVHYAIVAMILNRLFDAGWPIVGPGLLAAVMIAWCQAVQWSTANSLGVPFLICLSSFLALVFVTSHWTIRNGVTTPEFIQTVGIWHALGFALATLACVGVGTVGFASQRRGSGIDGRRLLDWLSERIHFRPAAAKSFASANSAQCWSEWTTRGYVLPLAAAVIGTAAILLALSLPAHAMTHRASDAVDLVGFLCGYGFWIMPLFVACIFLGGRSQNSELGPFQGSRPLSDHQIATAILKSATLGLISYAAIYAASMGLVFWIVIFHREMPLHLPAAGHTIDAVGMLAGVGFVAMSIWSLVGLGTSLALAGRDVFRVAFALAFALGLAAVFVPMCLPDERSRAEFLAIYFRFCLVLGLFGCAWTFLVARRRHLISAPTIGMASAIVLTAVVALYFFGVILSRPERLFALGCCGLLPIPVAAAPLAVYVNRHR